MPETQAELTKVGGGAGGFTDAAGVGIGCMIPIGVALCLTGIGAIIGVPLIIAGLIMPFQGLQRRKMLQGPCPWCRQPVRIGTAAVGFNCPACAKRIIVRSHNFIGME